MVIPYMDIARGSPCVVPSFDRIVSSSMNISALSLYMFVIITASEGHREWMLISGAFRLSELKALFASTNRMASLSFSSNSLLITCTPASHPEI